MLVRSTNSAVDLGDIFPMTGQSPFTVSAWVKFTTPGDGATSVAVARHRAGTVAGYILAMNASGGYGALGKAWFYQSTGPGLDAVSTTTVNDGEWHHMVAVHNDAGLTRIFVDGIPDEHSLGSTPISEVGVHLLVGGLYVGSTPTGYFNGFVDDVQIYDVALSCREIEAIYQNPGMPVEFAAADLNGDGSVDGADLGLLLAVWGTCPTLRGLRRRLRLRRHGRGSRPWPAAECVDRMSCGRARGAPVRSQHLA